MAHGRSLHGQRTVAAVLLSAATLLLVASSPSVSTLEGSRAGRLPEATISRSLGEVVPFDTDHWHLNEGSSFVSFGGRRALAGTAYLKGVSFLNGTIEADAWIAEAVNFAGFLFRTQSFEESGWFWLRTGKTNGLVADAIQYAPAFHRVFCWQLRPDAIGPVHVPKNQWVHMKLEVLGDSAALYVGDMANPALKVGRLGLGSKPGSAGLQTQTTGSVYFSNFSYRIDEGAPVAAAPSSIPPNVLAAWEMSPSYPIAGVGDVPTSYSALEVEEVANWIRPEVEPSGLINITRYHGTKYHGRAGVTEGRPTYAILRTFIDADRDRHVRMDFGYSDAATIFLNRTPLFSGNSAFVSGNIAYGGWISFNDAVFLDLKQGRNELVAVVAEDFGGWGWQARLDAVEGLRVSSGQ